MHKAQALRRGTDDSYPAPSAQAQAKRALAWSAAVLLGYLACHQADAAPPLIATLLREGLGFVLVGVPLLGRGGRAPRLFGPTAKASLRAALRLGVFVLPAWVLARSLLWHAFVPVLPADGAAFVAAAARAAWVHVVAVALPEEAFWRGYVQPALQARWPSRRTLWGAPMGAAQLASCALFACSHVAGGGGASTLSTFLPGLLFTWLMARHHALCGPWLLHAACNLTSLAAAELLPAFLPAVGPVVPV